MKSAAIFLFAMLLFAQPTAPSAVPLTKEPGHHLFLDNPQTQVFKVEVPPHATTMWHRHAEDYIGVVFENGRIENVRLGADGQPGTPTQDSFPGGVAVFQTGPVSHQVTNLMDSPFRNVTIEVKKKSTQFICGFPGKPECPTTATIDGGSYTEKTLFETDAVRAKSVTYEPGAINPEHEHALPHLVVIVNGGELESVPEGKPPVRLASPTGEVGWVPAGVKHAVRNVGNTTVKMITVEYK